MSPREAAMRILTGKSGVSRGSLLSRVKDHSDRALAESLVNGVTKWRGLIDHVLASFSSRALRTLSPRVLAALRIGVFQLLMMGIPPHASVSTVVNLLKGRGDRGFVNAVLRAMARQAGHVEMPSLDESPAEYAALRFSYPPWIAGLFIDRFGTAAGLRLCDFGNSPPSLTLRVNRLKTTPEAFLRRLAAGGVAAEPGPIPQSVRLLHGLDVTAIPGFWEGEFVVQDVAAMIVSLVVGAKPGEAVWDACAAPGGKTAHLAEMMQGTGSLIATDIKEARAAMVRETVDRLGLPFVEVLVGDAAGSPFRSGPSEHGPRFDRVLLDAPCSGLGVMRRNPDLRWNRRPSDVRAMALRQRALLNSVSRELRPGGILVYSTCTLTPEENEETWTRFLEGSGMMTPEDPAAVVPPDVGRLFSGAPFAGPGYRYLLPQESGTDGFFVARARRLPKGT